MYQMIRKGGISERAEPISYLLVSTPLQGAGIHITRVMVCCGALHRKRAAVLSLPAAAIPDIV